MVSIPISFFDRIRSPDAGALLGGTDHFFWWGGLHPVLSPFQYASFFFPRASMSLLTKTMKLSNAWQTNQDESGRYLLSDLNVVPEWLFRFHFGKSPSRCSTTIEYIGLQSRVNHDQHVDERKRGRFVMICSIVKR